MIPKEETLVFGINPRGLYEIVSKYYWLVNKDTMQGLTMVAASFCFQCKVTALLCVLVCFQLL